MKKIMTLLIIATLLSCETSVEKTKHSQNKTAINPQVALEVMNDYVENANARKDAGKWVRNQELLTDNFKKDYEKMMREAWENDPEMGLGFDPVLDAQDFPEKGFEIKSVDSKTGLITLQGVDWPEFVVFTKLTEVNGQWLVDGAGVIRIPK
nr:hypothetical protein [uncultured Fluviicola sp.]